MYITKSLAVTLLFVLLGSVLGGCVGTSAFSNSARGGDTVTLALGSPDGMDKATTTVAYFPDSDPVNPIDLTSNVTGLFKLYPDPASYTWLQSNATAIAGRSGHGPWLVVMSIDLPTGLPVGTGSVRVTPNAETTYPRFVSPVNLTDIALEILPGTGSPHPFEYVGFSGSLANASLARLQPRKQVIVKPPVLAEGSQNAESYGAVEIVLNIQLTSDDGSPIVDEGIAVYVDPQPSHVNSQLQMFWSRNGDVYTIRLVSPKGLYQHEIRTSISPKFPSYLYTITGTPSLQSITYYDLNGNLTTGGIPNIVVGKL